MKLKKRNFPLLLLEGSLEVEQNDNIENRMS